MQAAREAPDEADGEHQGQQGQELRVVVRRDLAFEAQEVGGVEGDRRHAEVEADLGEAGQDEQRGDRFAHQGLPKGRRGLIIPFGLS
ncbi:hypothetical protein D3C78_1565130 [compost metagenome]